MAETIFHKIVDGSLPSYKVWEDENYLAFLTPFPNTEGLTVVIPKQSVGGYLFKLSDDQVTGLTLAASKVAKILEKAFKVKRVAMVVEGTGVDYVHYKLYPLKGKLAEGEHPTTSHQEFYPEYIGYMTTAEGPKMSDEKLKEVQAKILKAAKD